MFVRPYIRVIDPQKTRFTHELLAKLACSYDTEVVGLGTRLPPFESSEWDRGLYVIVVPSGVSIEGKVPETANVFFIDQANWDENLELEFFDWLMEREHLFNAEEEFCESRMLEPKVWFYHTGWCNAFGTLKHNLGNCVALESNGRTGAYELNRFLGEGGFALIACHPEIELPLDLLDAIPEELRHSVILVGSEGIKELLPYWCELYTLFDEAGEPYGERRVELKTNALLSRICNPPPEREPMGEFGLMRISRV